MTGGLELKAMKSISEDTYLIVLGAGPCGRSAIACLRAADLETRSFGEPMSFRKRQMLYFVSGTEFASKELIRPIARDNRRYRRVA
jgi:hypothetical protein